MLKRTVQSATLVLASIGGFGWLIVSTGDAASAQHLSILEIEQVGDITTDGFIGLTLYQRDPQGVQLCNAPVLCETAVSEPRLTCLSGRVLFSNASNPVLLAEAFRDGLLQACSGDLGIYSSGNLLFITSPVDNIECCVYSSEIGIVDDLARGLNVGDGPAGRCTAHNVGDGVFGNEAQIAQGGFSFSRSEIPPFVFKQSSTIVADLFLRRSDGRFRATILVSGALVCVDSPVTLTGPNSASFVCNERTIHIERQRQQTIWRIGRNSGQLCPR